MNKLRNGVSRRSFIKYGIKSSTGLLLAQNLLAQKAAAQSTSKQPNVLLMLTDQQHRNTISSINTHHTQTPGLNRLYEQGTYFDRSYCTSPVCSPSRSSMFTSRMPSETGVFENGHPIRNDLDTVAHWLSQKAGYDTVYAGKWHLPHSSTSEIPGFRVLTPGIGGRGMLADTSVSMACEGYLRNYKIDKPFFMVASFTQPHDICQWIRVNRELPDAFDPSSITHTLPELPDNFTYDANEPEPVRTYRASQHQSIKKWTREHWRYYMWSYYRMIEQVDGEIENILLALQETGLDQNTLIIYTSDHGEGLAEHQLTIKNVLYEAATRVPFIFSYPGNIPQKKIDFNHLVSGLDIFPTICDYIGLEPPEFIKGKSLKPILDGEQVDWRSFLVAESTR